MTRLILLLTVVGVLLPGVAWATPDVEAEVIAAWQTGPVYLGADPGVRLDAAALRQEIAATSGRPGVGRVYFAMVDGLPDNGYLFDDLFGAIGAGNTIVLLDGLAVDVKSAQLDQSVNYFDLGHSVIASYARPLLETHDATGAVLAALRGLRGVTPATAPAPRSVPPATATVNRIAAAFRQHPTYTDPALPGTVPDQPGALVAVLPTLSPGAPDPALAPALAKLFPDKLILIDRGGWLSYAGPGPAADLARAWSYALGYGIGDLLYVADGSSAATVEAFIQRLTELRDGTISQHQVPLTAAPTAANVAGYLAPWAFAGTALGLAIVVLGGWELRRARQRRRAEAELRAGRAASTAALARLAGEILRAEKSGRAGPAAERLATATTLAEHAASAAEFATATAVADEGLADLA